MSLNDIIILLIDSNAKLCKKYVGIYVEPVLLKQPQSWR